MSDIHIILGNQLFPLEYLKKIKTSKVFMREDLSLCTYQKHHKHKLIMFLSSMRSYRDMLKQNNINVNYQELNTVQTGTYKDELIKYIKSNKIKNIRIWKIEDKWFEKEIKSLSKHGIKITEYESPMFLTNLNEFGEMCPSRKGPKYKMTDFYINQRKKLGLLVKDGKPVGGKWTYDNENRKKLPKDIDIPNEIEFSKTIHTQEVADIIDKHFPNHHGNCENFNHPTTRNQALKNLNHFIAYKFKDFGDYEDSVDSRSHLWFHSNLSSSLNLGLVTPFDIINKIRDLKDIPINSYEGFLRQIIGWREFMRCIYHYESENIERSNFFAHKRKLADSWYEGNTGLGPLDYSIKSTVKYAYSHHIERLMIQVNLMNLCEIEPKYVYKWFMELYIDSSDWVMTPNVYSMGLFSDGGIMATKPYICGSNYILKMMHFKKDKWCDIMDGLYWRFIDKNRNYFKKNPRLNMMISLFDKMNKERKKLILNHADEFIKKNTK